jgi:alpha-beta hydrolase superfamily lysophospholipase
MNTNLAEQLETSEELISSEGWMISYDGTTLFYRSWIPDTHCKKAVILFHRGHEHSARWEEVVHDLELKDTAFFAWDARGHGRSPGERGYAENFGVYVKDMDTFIHFISSQYGIAMENIVVIAHSVGAVIASTWVHDYAPSIRALVLATPAFDIKLYVPLAIPGLRALHTVKPKSFIRSYVGGKLLTHSPKESRRYDTDQQICRAIAVNILLDLNDTSKRIVNDAAAIRTPTLMLSAGSDLVVKLRPQQEFFDKLSSPLKEMEVLEGFYHSIFHEQERHKVISRIREFISKSYEEFSITPSLLHADEAGYTKEEHEQLSRPLSALYPRNLSFKFQTAMLQTMGRLSSGIRLGWKTGFDSGQSLDYVYENRSRGITPLGRLIDHFYLNSIGWRGIRQRKINLSKTLEKTILNLHHQGEPIRIVDIAAGPGRYLLDTVAKHPDLNLSALLRDWNEGGLEAGRALAKQMGISNVTYEKGDAFDAKSLASINPRPTIAIVSGLYELFPSNEMVNRSLKGLASAVPSGGFLIYTNQPWHPQVEMIARVLTNREGKPWVMRRRTQAEMDELVAAAGFEKVDMQIDPWGIFTVSLARRK